MPDAPTNNPVDQTANAGFTASAVDVTQLGQTAQPPKKASHTFRLIFLFLLLAVLIAAGAVAYILWSGNKPQVVVAPSPLPTKQENVFVPENDTTTTNPFAQDSQPATTNPFTATDSANPFDQFEASASTETSINPF